MTMTMEGKRGEERGKYMMTPHCHVAESLEEGVKEMRMRKRKKVMEKKTMVMMKKQRQKDAADVGVDGNRFLSLDRWRKHE